MTYFVSKCAGCGANVGEMHAPDCSDAFCWSCETFGQCRHRPFIYCGDLDAVFSSHNRHHAGMSLDEYDHLPVYRDGKLVGLITNRFDLGVWRAIQESPQSKNLVDLTFKFPHLNLQLPEDCVNPIIESPWCARLQVVQVGEMGRDWGEPGNCENAAAEGEDIELLVGLIEKMPALTELYLSVWYPNLDALLKAKFPSQLTILRVNTRANIDLEFIANNSSLKTIKSLTLVRDCMDEPEVENFHDGLRRLVNESALTKLEEFAIELPEIDDLSCEIVGSSEMIKTLRRLRLCGQGITDAGAAILSKSPAMRGLQEVVIESGEITEQGIEQMREAGIIVRDPD